MLSTRLRSLQLELNIHRRWLSGFLQRTQSARFSTSLQQSPSLYAQNDGGRGRSPGKKTGRSNASEKLEYNIRKTTRKDHPRDNPIIVDIRQKTREGNIAHVISNYNALNDRDKGTLQARDVRQIAQCLHHSVRTEEHSAANQKRRSNMRELVDFADVLVEDIRDSKLAASWKANLHLIGIFKESGLLGKGVEFWSWLSEQDEPLLSADCYGAAIELLAVDGKPLPELEKLYQEALSRFPGNFAAYHLSPNALLPDREQMFTIGGTSISLLQGILTARLMNGDVRNAYLALDTAMRILPDQVPTRLFALFLDERPVEEAYALFALAGRGGNIISSSYYRNMLGTIRKNSSLASPKELALGVRAMLSVSHMFIGTGGTVAGNSVNELVIAATQFLRVDGVNALSAKDKQKIAKEVMDVVRGLFEIFARYGAKPSIAAFNSIITNVGGFGSSKQTIGIALKDADTLGLTPTDVTWRSIMAVGGMFKDRGLVERTWSHLRDSRIENEQNPSASDIHSLVKPAHLAGAIDFALAELEKLRDVLEIHEYDVLLGRFNDPSEADVHSSEHTEPVNLEDILAEINNVKADIEVIKQRTEGSPAVQDFSQQTLPMTLQPPASDILLMPDAQMRKIYDLWTSDPDSPPITDVSTLPAPAISKTGVTFGTLRYESWRMVNELMRVAEENDRRYRQQVDEAIAAGKMPPRRTAGLVPHAKSVVSWGLSSVTEVKQQQEFDDEKLESVREDIRRFRSSGDRP